MYILSNSQFKKKYTYVYKKKIGKYFFFTQMEEVVLGLVANISFEFQDIKDSYIYRQSHLKLKFNFI